MMVPTRFTPLEPEGAWEDPDDMFHGLAEKRESLFSSVQALVKSILVGLAVWIGIITLVGALFRFVP